MAKVILVTGATGKQGGSVIEALCSHGSTPSDFTILAVTRDVNSASAHKLIARYPSVQLVAGNLDDVPAIFQKAQTVTSKPIWGVYSVQISMGKNVTFDSEIKQGTDLIDESIKHGVQHFVYSSVDRGGDDKSWDNPTPIPHFQTKHRIEQHLRDVAGQKMGWTILRPVAFMDNMQPGFQTKVFLTALRDTLDGKPLQWVATADIGVFAAKAFAEPAQWNHKAVGLAGEETDMAGLSAAFESKTGAPVGTTYSFLGSALLWGVQEMGTMIQWFKTDGYGADIEKLRRMHPGLMTLETWLEEKSGFETR